MKKTLLILLLSAGMVAKAQQKVTISNPIQGFWVVESNSNSPKEQMVKFYNSNQELLYQELYDRKVLNYSRKRIRMMLDSALVTVLKTENEFGKALKIAKVISRKR